MIIDKLDGWQEVEDRYCHEERRGARFKENRWQIKQIKQNYSHVFEPKTKSSSYHTGVLCNLDNLSI